MQIHLTPPLIVRTLNGRSLELLPVVMTGLPTSDPKVFIQFLKLSGRRIPIDQIESDKCLRYMRQHQTEALTEDGETAFTVTDALVECQPDLANELLAQLEVTP
jgi:hypothetical protein